MRYATKRDCFLYRLFQLRRHSQGKTQTTALRSAAVTHFHTSSLSSLEQIRSVDAGGRAKAALLTAYLAGLRPTFPGRFPWHRIVGAEIGDIVLGVGLGQLLRAEHLHGVPETYDPRWIIRHACHHPGVDVIEALVSHHEYAWPVIAFIHMHGS